MTRPTLAQLRALPKLDPMAIAGNRMALPWLRAYQGGARGAHWVQREPMQYSGAYAYTVFPIPHWWIFRRRRR